MSLYVFQSGVFQDALGQSPTNSPQITTEDNKIVCTYTPTVGQIGYYAIRISNARFRTMFPGDYYVITCWGFNEAVGVPNMIVIDADYTDDICMGVYFRTVYATEMTLSFIINAQSNLIDDTQIDYFSRTQSPVFNTPPNRECSIFVGLFRSTEGASGYDVVMDLSKILVKEIYPNGNLLLDFSDVIAKEYSGRFFLRSRLVRLGCELHGDSNKFHIVNHSPVAVEILDRMIQYVPLNTFNGDVLNTPGVLHSSVSLNSTFPNGYGQIAIKQKKRKDKWRC